MTIFATQYLEDGPGVAAIAPDDARARLRAACERLPISVILIGWNLPRALVGACAKEAVRAGIPLFRWHPVLTGDGTFVPRPEWEIVGLDGDPVPGFRGMSQFTFVCPNRPAVREAVLHHLYNVLQRGYYQGVLLDRIRYPSPADRQQLLMLKLSQGLSNAEVGQIMGHSEGAIKQLHYPILCALRQDFKPHGEDR